MDRIVKIRKHRIAFFRNGKLHRSNGVAVIYPDGCYNAWWKDGKILRIIEKKSYAKNSNL